MLSRVTLNFTDPAADVSSRVGMLSDDFVNKQAKLRDLRNKMNNATQKINDATTSNAVNRKNLSEMTEALNSELEMPGTSHVLCLAFLILHADSRVMIFWASILSASANNKSSTFFNIVFLKCMIKSCVIELPA